MNTNTSFSNSHQMQHFLELHHEELESVVQTLATITSLSADQVKPHVNTMVRQLVQQQEEHPFYETATPLEWINAFRAWAANHHHNAPPLSDYAVSRDNMYEDEKL